MSADLKLSNSTSRRAVVKGAAWSVPVIAAAVAAPAASASTSELGALAPGFTLTASPTAPIPAGTVITITGSGVANIGVFSVTGGVASVAVLSGTSRQVTLTAPLAAGQTLNLRTTLSISVAFGLNASVTLPSGYTATGGKLSGNVNSTLVLCSAN